MIYGAVLAGGLGRRMERQTIPKQFMELGGVPILILTLRRFLECDCLDVVYVAVHPDWLAYADELCKSNLSSGERARVRLVAGGRERLDSFLRIIEDVDEKRGLGDDDILICHDAVRPFVRRKMIEDCVRATEEYGFALTVIPMADTPHVAHEQDFLDGTLPRDGLYSGQTPSGFHAKTLKALLEGLSEEEKCRSTGTTQLVLKAGHRIRIVEGHTSNFKITTDVDLDLAERVMLTEAKKRTVSILDCTLRDGGIVIDFNFGTERMCAIKDTLERSGVEYIECGYIDEKKGSPAGRTCFDSEKAIEQTLLADGKKPGVTYLAMIDYATFDPERLGERTPSGIDGIRLAFHKEDWRDAVAWGRAILRKGYQLCIQPMVTARYTSEEYRELIETCNEELEDATAFYIADTFGQLNRETLLERMRLADALVSPKMKLGLHAHNNRQMANSNALAFLANPAQHDLMVDASIAGMGKGAGNVCTELLASALNREGKHYDTTALYESIHDYFSPQQRLTPWGYSLDYYLSSVYSCTPSYIKIFKADERVTPSVLVELLETMPEEKKARCDRTFAAAYLKNYFTR